MTITEAIAKRTRELLYKTNMSQYRLIKESCLDKTTIQGIFKSKTKDIKMSTVFLIAEAFNMSMQEFLNVEYFNKDSIDL